MSKMPLCKDSLGWMFSRLDTNFDLQLDQSELSSLSSEKSDVCTKAFLRSCDPDETGLFPARSGVLAFRDIKVNFSPIQTVIVSQADIGKHKSAWLFNDKINAFG